MGDRLEVKISKELQDVINSIPDKPLLRVDEVAVILQIKKRTVYAWYEEGKIKGTNINGLLRIYRASLIELIMSGDNKKTIEDILEGLI